MPNTSRTVARVALCAALLTGGLHAATRRSHGAGDLTRAASATPAVRPAHLAVPSAGRCTDLASRYRTARAAQAACTSHEGCQVRPREWSRTGLDDCFLATSRERSPEAGDRLAGEWEAEGCLASVALCPPITPRALCQEGTCVAAPPEGIPESWQRVDSEEALSLFVPPGMVEETVHALCGNGPRVRQLAGAGLRVRIEMGNPAGYLPIDTEEPVPDRVTYRQPGRVGLHPATWISLKRAQVSSRALAPDGTWPRYEPRRILVIDGVESLPAGSWLGPRESPSSAVIVIEGERVGETVTTQILSSVTLW
jgi:hypothetical protein